MPRNYYCETCKDTGTILVGWFGMTKTICPTCGGDPMRHFSDQQIPHRNLPPPPPLPRPPEIKILP